MAYLAKFMRYSLILLRFAKFRSVVIFFGNECIKKIGVCFKTGNKIASSIKSL